jgi:glycosyltransferase involved in cell wall biosynthesis
MSATTLCLNMIVKNESKIITRLLESVSDIIDQYCICDTGSTDNTVDLIREFFKEKGIPGKIVNESFQDFGYNRSFSLKACESMDADYILLLDADMIFQLNPKITAQQFKEGLRADAYHIYQGTEHFFYKNVRIVKNRMGFSYWGVTHEYVKAPDGAKYEQFERDYCFINDIGDGGCKDDKFLRDVRLLSKGLEEHPNNDRYTFYLANSLRDSGQHEKAIETYKKRVQLGGWIEEIWQSYYNIGKCYKHMDDMPRAVYYWLEAYNVFPCRIENLYEVVQYYRHRGQHNLAYTYYSLADYERKKNKTWDYLFLQKDIYDYKLDYELSIIGYYCNRDNHNMVNTCMKVLAHSGADEGICRNVLSNYKFYTDSLSKWAIPISPENAKVLATIGQDVLAPYIGEFVSSTPSICFNGSGELCICVRYVNYRIDDNGGYVNQGKIETKNVIATVNTFLPTWTKTSECILEYDTTADTDNVYVGLEDVRLFTTNEPDTIYYNANRGLSQSNIVVEHGQIMMDQADGKTSAQTNSPATFLTYDGQRQVEKNWVLFDKTKAIYQWSPLTIGDIQGSTFQKTHEIATPNFFRHVRGSTNGLIIDDEIWFIAHVVSYEDRRYYYHVMIVLDKTTYQVKKYTPLFTFDKNKVEYTLGFVFRETTRRFIIGYSVMDRETKYIMISKHIFDTMMIENV